MLYSQEIVTHWTRENKLEIYVDSPVYLMVNMERDTIHSHLSEPIICPRAEFRAIHFILTVHVYLHPGE